MKRIDGSIGSLRTQLLFLEDLEMVTEDFFAGIRDIVGGRSAAYEKELRQAKQLALQEMQDQAASLGANAVVGVDLDYETIGIGQTGNMLMVSANGTAVVISGE